jgi:hypothetical protein
MVIEVMRNPASEFPEPREEERYFQPLFETMDKLFEEYQCS